MNDPRASNPQTTSQSTSVVDFGGSRQLAILGLLSGAAIAIIVPWMTFRYADRLSPNQQLIIVIIAISIGGLVALTAAFFGTVMPMSVRDSSAPDRPKSAADGPEVKQQTMP
jgi:hypothetical protein